MKDNLETGRGRLLLSVLINLPIIIFYLAVYYPIYETNDDSAMMSLACGAKGAYESHVIYQNYLLGRLYTLFYRISGGIPWYALFQYLLLFVSFCALSFAILTYLKRPVYLGLLIIMLSVYGYETYVKMQCTKTAGTAITAGLTLMFVSLFSEKLSLKTLLAGGALAWIGSLYRLLQFFCLVAVFSAIVLYLILYLKEISKGHEVRRFLVSLFSAMLLLLAVGGAELYNKSQYQTEEWREFTRFDELRSELMDYGVPSYKENKEAYDKIGLNLSAVRLLGRQTFMDSEVFTPDVLEQVIHIKEKNPKQINVAFFKNYAKDFLKGMAKQTIFHCFLLMLLCWLAFGKHGIRELVTFACAAVMLLTIYGYLYYQGRFLIHRVDVGIWLAATVMLFFAMKADKTRFLIPVTILLVVVCLPWMQYRWQDNWKSHMQKRLEYQKKQQEIVEKIHKDQDHLYLTKIRTVSLRNGYGVLEQIPFGIGDNMYPLGGWMAPIRSCRNVLDRYGIHNPLRFRDMIDNEKILLVDNDIEMTLDYLKYYYDENVQAVEEKPVGQYHVYHIVTQ